MPIDGRHGLRIQLHTSLVLPPEDPNLFAPPSQFLLGLFLLHEPEKSEGSFAKSPNNIFQREIEELFVRLCRYNIFYRKYIFYKIYYNMTIGLQRSYL